MIKGGQEVIVGAVTDGSFGKLVAFGLGGVLVEVLKDITFRLAPATRDDALSMLDGIQAAEMLKGVRGGEPVNRDALADADRARRAAGQRLPRDLRDGPEPGVRDQATARSPPTCASSSTSRRSRARYRPAEADVVDVDEPHHAAEGGGGDRRLRRGRQDRQLGDEEPDQRRLQGHRSTRSTRRPPRSWATRPTRA